jgi:hypothetical protein
VGAFFKEVYMRVMCEDQDLSEITKSKQIKRVIEYLKTHESISAYQAVRYLSIGSPRKIFSDMRKKGINLQDKWVNGVNKYGEKWRAKQYWIEED